VGVARPDIYKGQRVHVRGKSYDFRYWSEVVNKSGHAHCWQVPERTLTKSAELSYNFQECLLAGEDTFHGLSGAVERSQPL